MRKLIIALLLLVTYGLVTCDLSYAEYTGGSGAGWGYCQITPTMYHGGSGDGDHMAAYSTDTAVGYSTATKLAFTTAPSNSYAGVAFDTQPVIEIRDADNNKVLSATDTVSLAIANDGAGSGSSLGGTTSMAAVAGVADFSGKGLNITRAGTGYTLSASATGLTSATSSAFNTLSPVQVSSPNGGEVWVVSTAYNITWNTYGSLATGQNTVKYSLNNGSSWTTLSTNATSPLSWVTPATASTQCLVQVLNSADVTFTDNSNSAFKLAGGFTVVSPNGGETWANGYAHTIQWQTTGTVANVKLEYSADGGSTWTTISASTTNTGEYSWTPAVTSGGTNYKIRVSDASDSDVKDESNSSFTVQKVSVTAPTAEQRIQANSSANITWTSGGISNVKIEYSVNDGAWTQITGAESLTASTGSYSWSVPNDFTTSTNVKVKVSSTTADPNANTASSTSSSFTIYGQLTLDVPSASGIEWAANSAHSITWTTNKGTITNVKLEYSSDNFVSDVNTIIASTSNTGSYSWTPTTTGTTFKIRVSDAQDSLVSDASDNYFSVTGIGITAPASGATWNCGSSQTITWNYTGSFTNVKIEYSTDNGSNWATIISSTLNDGSYDWTVANTPSATAKIRISDAADADPVATSDAFNIKSVIAVTAPNGGETVTVGSSTNITWTNTGTISNVKLEYYNGSSWVTIVASTTNNNTYSWTVPDAITSSAKVRVSDADSGHPASNDESNAVFTIKSNMAITAPTSGLNWAVAEAHNITWTNTGTVGQIRLYYATEKDNYAAWTEITSGATTNNNIYSWTVSDIIQAVGQDPQADPNLAVKVKVTDAVSGHPSTEAVSSAFNVIYYTITWTVKDSQTQNHLANLSVTCTSGWSASSLTSGVNTARNYPYGTYTTIWSKADYSDSSYSNWAADSSKTLAVTMTLSSVAGQEYHVFSNFTYDATSDTFKINSWLEQSGAIVTGPTSCTVSMEDKDGNAIDINGAGAGNNLTSISPNDNGVFRLGWDLTNIDRNTSYFGKVQIVYQGATYSSNITYQISVPAVSTVAQVTALGADFTAHRAATEDKISAIESSVGAGLATKVNTLQTDMTSVKTAVGADQGTTLYSQVASILEDTGTTIPDTIASELKKGPRSKILNRPTSIISGEKVTIRYQTDSGKSPAITVYDDNNTARISGATMAEIGTSGVYEYEVTFQSGWGTGDYTVICSESATNSVDSMIINVGSGTGLTGIESKVDTLTTTLNTVNTNISTMKSVIGTTSDASTANTLYGKLSGVSTNVSNIAANWGSYKVSDIIGYVDSLEEYLGAPTNAAGQQTVFGKMAEIKNYVGDTSGLETKVNSAYNEIQQLRKEVDFNGKSETAYTLVKNINSAMEEIKKLIGNAGDNAGKEDLEKLTTSTEEARKALQALAEKQGLKGAVEKEAYKGPATLDSLQNQVTELRKMTEAVKTMMEKKEEPVVKTWFEQGEKK